MKVKAKQSFSDSTVGFVTEGSTIDVDATTMKRVESLVDIVEEKKTVKKPATRKPKPVAKKSDTPRADA